MKAQAALSLTKRAARRNNLRIEELHGRGKGSHRIYVVLDSDGNAVGRFGLTFHPQDLSWTVLRNLEDGLTHLFGDKWMEQR